MCLEDTLRDAMHSVTGHITEHGDILETHLETDLDPNPNPAVDPCLALSVLPDAW